MFIVNCELFIPSFFLKNRLILLSLSFGVFVAADDLTVVSTMLRQIVFDLEIPLPEGLDQAAWIVNAYLIAYVVVMPFVGKLGDVFGRKRTYLISLFLFLFGSIWVILPFNPLTTSLFPNSMSFFLIGRVITAFGGGAMVPVSLAIIADSYAPERRASALGVLGAIDTAGWVWGPLYGALLVRYLNWQWQFYLNIPLTLIAIILAYYALRDLPEPTLKPRIDWIGAVLLTASLICLNIALLNSGDIQAAGGFADLDQESKVSTLPLYIAATATFVLFVLQQRRLTTDHRPQTIDSKINNSPIHQFTNSQFSSPSPLIDLHLFTRPNFTPAILINFIVGAILIIAMVNVPLVINVLEIDVGQAAITSGVLLAVMTGAMAIMAFVGGKWTERAGYRVPSLAGLLACVAGMGLMGFLWTSATPYAQMGWQLAILGVGFGLVTTPIQTAVVNAAPADQRGIASSLAIVLRLIGMSVGLSALTAWGLYRFGILRQNIDLPPLNDPNYQNALVNGLIDTTVATLAETFLISAGAALFALLFASRFRIASGEKSA